MSIILDNHGNKVTTKTYFKDLEKEFIKHWKQMELDKRNGKLNVNNTYVTQYSEWTVEERAELLYDIFTTFYIKRTDCYKGYLTEQDIDSFIWESAWEVAKLDPLEIFTNINHYIYNTVRGKCSNEHKKRQAIKRGGQVQFIYIDDKDNYTQLEATVNELDILEWQIFIEQIKDKLSVNEYKYLKLLIDLPQLESNVYMASRLGISEGGIRKIKKSLHSKLSDLLP